MSRKIIRFLPLILLIGLMVAAFHYDLHQYVTLEKIQAQKESFQSYVEKQPVLAPLIFIGIYIGAVTLSLPIATFLTLLGGFLFGLVQGTLFVVTAATFGSTIIFMIAKSSLGDSLRKRAGKLYKKIESNMKENAFGYLLFMRLVPVFPFVLVNIAPALFNIPLRTFFLTTFFGIIPGTAAFVYFGQQLGDIEKVSDLVSIEMLLAFGVLGVFALIPTIYKQIKLRKMEPRA